MAPEGSPKGHLKPLGHEDFRDSWAGDIDVLQELSPQTFWKEYHAKRKPFLLKGGANSSLAMKWDDEYLMNKFGDEIGKTEWKNEDRLTDYCRMEVQGEHVKCPKNLIPYVETRMNIRTFINRSLEKPKEFQKYIISQMPDKMGHEWEVPAFHLCGQRRPGEAPKDMPWLTQMGENNFWYVRTEPGEIATSVVHFDMNHQIMCLFAGRKEWIMWDLQTEASKIPMWNEYYRAGPNGETMGSDDSPIDGERVDLLRWPEFAKAKWATATMEPGDCIFTPAKLLHYVRSYSVGEDRRTIALMTMFGTSETFSPEHCTDGLPSHITLDKFDTLWDFPGSDAAPRCKNHIKMGYPHWKREVVLPIWERLKGQPITEKVFVKAFYKVAENEPGRKYPKDKIKQTYKQLEADGMLTGDAWLRSEALRDLARDICCFNEGHDRPYRHVPDGVEWTARNETALARKEQKTGVQLAVGRTDL